MDLLTAVSDLVPCSLPEQGTFIFSIPLDGALKRSKWNQQRVSPGAAQYR